MVRKQPKTSFKSESADFESEIKEQQIMRMICGKSSLTNWQECQNTEQTANALQFCGPMEPYVIS
jgi:hypothetical protein